MGGTVILACPSSKAPEPVLAVARALAERDGAAIVLAHVLPRRPDRFDTTVFSHVMDDVVNTWRREALAWLDSLVVRDLAGMSVEILEGEFAEQVVLAATRVAADLIVMDADDAVSLAHRRPCPILAVPAGR